MHVHVCARACKGWGETQNPLTYRAQQELARGQTAGGQDRLCPGPCPVTVSLPQECWERYLEEEAWCPEQGLGIKDIPPLQECGLSCPSEFRPSPTCSPQEMCPTSPLPPHQGLPEGQVGGPQNRSGSLGVSWRWSMCGLSEGCPLLPHTFRPLHHGLDIFWLHPCWP